MSKEITLFESPWLGLYRKGHWDYARRPNSDACVGILATTDDQEVILIEQFRIPVNQRVIEIPAGLVGDELEFKGESLAETAHRELLEETGYHAEKIELAIASPTSAGMTPEITYLFHATNLQKKTDGGGNGGEDIKTCMVKISELREFLREKEEAGYLIDFKIHAALAATGINF